MEIDFERGADSPSRVFRAMTGLIEAFESIDRELARSIDVKIEPVLILEDIEAGSIRTWLRTVLEAIEDDALKNLDWKPLIGKYLVRGKYLLIDFTKDRTTVTDRRELQEVSQKLLKAAEETNVKRIPHYQPITDVTLAHSVRRISEALEPLRAGDQVRYVTQEERATFNLEFRFAPDAIDDLLTTETITNRQAMILKVKRPDYLGESMWDFQYENRTISARISDMEWLSRFQRREVDVRPGDALRAEVVVTSHYGESGEVVTVRYEVARVVEVIAYRPPTQNRLFDGE